VDDNNNGELKLEENKVGLHFQTPERITMSPLALSTIQ
jgi:hypothetical protein